MGSILDDVKHNLGLLPEQQEFDVDILMHINSVFSTLAQLGVGPAVGFEVNDNSVPWSEFMNDARFNAIKSYIFLRVKLLFDPPQVGFVIASIERQIQELEWRLNVVADYG